MNKVDINPINSVEISNYLRSLRNLTDFTHKVMNDLSKCDKKRTIIFRDLVKDWFIF